MHTHAIVACVAVLVGAAAGCGADDAGGASTSSGVSSGASSAGSSGDEDGSSSASFETSSAAGGDATTSVALTTGGNPFAGCFHTWTFDDCAADWEVGAADPAAPSPPGWACGEPTGAIPQPTAHTSVWATSLVGEYTEDQSSYLASPSFSLADCAGATVYLSIAHLYEFGSGDGGIVQLSTDGGASWSTIEPSWHGYCAGTLAMPWSPPGGEPGFCGGSEDAWIHTLVEIDAYGGEADVRVRFVFGSDGIIEQTGWYIDSVATEAY